MITGKLKGALVALAVAMLLPGAAFAQIDTWTNSCTLDDTFATEGGIFASLGLVDFETWAEFDVDADSVPDAWQAQLLAYALCGGNATAQASFDNNYAEVENLITEFTALVNYIGANNDDVTAFGVALNALAGPEAACNSPASLAAAPPLDAYFAALQSSLPGITTIGDAYIVVGAIMADSASEYGPFPPVLGLLKNVLAELGGQSTEAQAEVLDIVPVADVATLAQALTVLQAIAANFVTACGVTLDAQAVALATTIGTPPTLSVPALQVFDLGSKAAGEDFAGAGDYNGDSVTNAQVAGYVAGASGDENDFVAGATGELGDFWLGNPNLPVAGLLGLGAAVCGLSAAGALTLRRRK